MRKPSAPISQRLGDHVGCLLAIHPDEYEDNFETSFGPTTVLWCKVLLVADDLSGKYNNLGRNPVFWTNVQAQLDDLIGEWTGGRLIQGVPGNAKAYMLVDPTEEEEATIDKIVASLEDF